MSLSIGTAAAWPLAAKAQQPAMQVIGFLDTSSPDAIASRLGAFRQGLKDTGYVEGENVAIEYRWAENRLDRLPELAAELVRRQVNVIVATGGPPSAFAAKAATATILVVFLVGEDPARLGLVASLARPGGNVTGINLFVNELEAKRLELMRELMPRAARVAVLVNPADATNTETTLRDVGAAAHAIGCKFRFSTPRPATRSTLPSTRSGTRGPTPCSSGPSLSSTSGVSNWSNWPRSTASPRPTCSVNRRKPAG
jgi:ABC-type uncharacterized transport system substrate-binding protein